MFFLGELQGLPPQRDVDLCIELHLDTLPISMTPHRMAPVDKPKTRCVKCTPICTSARVAPSNIVYSWYGYRSTGTGVLTTKVLLFR